MRRLVLTIALACLFASLAALAADKPVKRGVGGAVGTNVQVVPAGKTYVQLDQNNKEVARFAAGKSMGVTDCAQVPCPETFKPGTVCWKCKERPLTGATQAK